MECQNDSSKEWSCELNRCITSKASLESRQQYQACEKLTDPNQLKACVDNLAKNEIGTLEVKDLSSQDNIAAGVNGAFAALVLINKAFAKSQNTCTSAMIAAGGGVVGVLGYAYIKLSAEKKLKDLREDYQKEVEGTNPYDAQLRAFEYIKEEQLAIRDLAKTRRNTYILTAATYGVASAMAIFDKIKSGGACAETGGKVNKFSAFFNSSTGVALVSGAGAATALMMSTLCCSERAPH